MTGTFGKEATVNSPGMTIGLLVLTLLVGSVPIAERAATCRPRNGPTRFVYSLPKNILGAQLALQKLGHLQPGGYLPGEYDPPTREALRDFQRGHSLRRNGWLDRDTIGMLPIVDPAPDADDDGITDGGDACPGTPKGVRVNLDGCPRRPPPPPD